MKRIAKTALLTTIVCGMTAAVSAQPDAEPTLSRYMGGPAELVEAPTGASGLRQGCADGW